MNQSLKQEKLYLLFFLECDDCGEVDVVMVDLDKGLQTAIEQIEDNLPCKSCGSLTIHTNKIELTDGKNSYQITD